MTARAVAATTPPPENELGPRSPLSVGVIAACLAIAEATRQLLDGMSLDVVSLHQGTADLHVAPATRQPCSTGVRLTAG
ncbi:hypothetical protein ABZ307_42950 [Streptomyces griseorubiginosus]